MKRRLLIVTAWVTGAVLAFVTPMAIASFFDSQGGLRVTNGAFQGTGSKIYDSAELHIDTDNFMYILAPVALHISNDTFVDNGNFNVINGYVTSSVGFFGPGSGLTLLNAGNLASGTVADARLSSNVPLKNTANTFSAGQTISSGGLTVTGNSSIAGTLTGLTGLTVASGTVSLPSASIADAALSANVALKNINNSFSVGQTITGNSTITGTLSGLTGLTIGGGTSITGHLSTSQANVVSASVPATACATYSNVTVTGAAVGDTVLASPQAVAAGIETVNLIWNATVSATNNVLIRACNPTAGAIDTADTQTWRADVWKH